MGKKTVGIVLIAVLILVGGVAPYFIGGKAESAFRSGVDRFAEESGLPTTVVSYDRGWLHSHAVTRTTLDDTRIEIDHAITHGPLLVFGLASIDSRLPNDITPQLAQVLDESPLTARTKLGYGGGLRVEVASPEFEGTLPDMADAHMAWQGLDGYYSRDGNRTEMQLHAPGLTVDYNGVRGVFEDLSLSGAGSAMQNLGVEGKDVDWNSEGHAKLGRYQIYNDAGQLELAYGMKVDVSTANGDDDTVDSNVTYTLDDLQINLPSQPGQNAVDFGVDQAQFKFDLTGIKAAPLEDAMVELRDLDADAYDPDELDALQERMAQIFVKRLPALLSGTPQARLEIPPIDTGHGKLSGLIQTQLAAPDSLDGRAAEMARKMPVFGLIQRLKLDAHAFADDRLVDWSLDRAPEVTPAMRRQLDRQIETLIRQKLLQRDDDRIGFKLHYDKDNIQLNGEDVPPQMLQALLGGMR